MLSDRSRSGPAPEQSAPEDEVRYGGPKRAPRRAARGACRIARVLLAAMLIATAGALPADARKLYITRIRLLGLPVLRASSDKLTNVDDFYTEENLRNLFAGWDPVVDPKPGVEAGLDLRGLTLELGFEQGKDELYVRIPGVIDATFTGNGDRDSALRELEDWLRGAASTIQGAELKDLLQELVRRSPVDPVAGNPNSLMAKMVDADWRAGMRAPHERGVKGVGVPNFFGVQPGVSLAEACDDGCMTVASVDMPFTYDLHFDGAPVSILMDLPLAVTWTQSQWSVLVSAGLAGRYRIRDGWSLTAGFRAGAVGSINVGALAIMYSFSLENRYEWDWGPLRVGMGNQFVFIKTFDDIEPGGYAFDYGLQNEVLRNGLDFAGDLGTYFGRSFGWSLFGDYSHYFGTDLWAQDMGDVGTALHLRRDIGGRSYDRLRLSLRYFGARAYNGVRMDLELLF